MPELNRSPEQVSGRLRREGLPAAGREWIYRHVRADREAGGDPALICFAAARSRTGRATADRGAEREVSWTTTL